MQIKKNIDKIFVCLCYAIGIGSILFGSLSNNDYGHYFIVTGILALSLAVIHSARMTIKYEEGNDGNKNDARKWSAKNDE